MRLRHLIPLACAAWLAGCSTKPLPETGDGTFATFQKKGAQFHARIRLPEFETTPAALAQSAKQTMDAANAALDQIGRVTAPTATLTNTIGALDDVNYNINLTENRFSVIKETSTNAALRDAAVEQLKTLQEWGVSLDYREDVYRAVQAYADTKPALTGEDAKLLKDTLRDYRRAGLALPKAQRDEVEALRKKLSSLTTDFETHVTQATRKLVFSKADLEGVPEDFLGQKDVKNADGTYSIMANITWHYTTVMENARPEKTRLQMETARDSLAVKENVPLLQEILVTRDTLAHQLGYATWADYVIEVKMAKTSAQAMDFLQKLKTGLQPKFDAEIAEFKKLKAEDTGAASPEIHLWDWRYYGNQLKKRKYTVDEEQLRVYFPYQNALEGMFRIYQKIFGLKFERIAPPYQWVDGLQLYTVSDASGSGEPLGLFYLDMFPREGKYNHFAEFGLIDGKLLADGTYQCPVVSLICNFPSPQPDKPSLLSHRDVETLFHEFGHAMHAILTRAHYSRFAGTSVPGDFVEAPSQMLENWVWDKKVLDSFAADYRDPSKKIPTSILNQLKASKLAIEGTFYRRQLSFGLTDLVLHSEIHQSNVDQVVPLSNQTEADAFFPEPPGTAFVAYFGHLMGYDAGYYGYAWADAIAADMATVFEKAPEGFFDEGAGRRLRREVYEMGDSRDVEISIEKFLGRKRSLEPFLKKLGIAKDGGASTN